MSTHTHIYTRIPGTHPHSIVVFLLSLPFPHNFCKRKDLKKRRRRRVGANKTFVKTERRQTQTKDEALEGTAKRERAVVEVVRSEVE